jgi:hypothetical protein
MRKLLLVFTVIIVLLLWGNSLEAQVIRSSIVPSSKLSTSGAVTLPAQSSFTPSATMGFFLLLTTGDRVLLVNGGKIRLNK